MLAPRYPILMLTKRETPPPPSHTHTQEQQEQQEEEQQHGQVYDLVLSFKLPQYARHKIHHLCISQDLWNLHRSGGGKRFQFL